MNGRVVTAGLIVGAITLCIVGTGSAAKAPPVNGGLIGTGVLTYGTTSAPLSATRGMVMEWVTFAPGASSGWHYHRAPVAVAVVAGTLTLYDGKDSKCAPVRYSPGQGFIEPAGHIHIAINEGKTPVKIYVTYLGVPGNWRKNPTPLDVLGLKNPGNCPASIK